MRFSTLLSALCWMKRVSSSARWKTLPVDDGVGRVGDGVGLALLIETGLPRHHRGLTGAAYTLL
jgi:hypothetical protein